MKRVGNISRDQYRYEALSVLQGQIAVTRSSREAHSASRSPERPPAGAVRKCGDGVPAQVSSSSSDRGSKLR
ncbi:hypothetical protein AVEN_209163-1, partial [Araneus ventricosus]